MATRKRRRDTYNAANPFADQDAKDVGSFDIAGQSVELGLEIWLEVSHELGDADIVPE